MNTVSKIKTYGVLALAFAAVATPPYCYFDREEYIAKVEFKESVPHDGGHQYRVHTDKGVFRNEDAWLFLKFDSADMQGKLTVGDTFKIKANGWRIPLFSMFRNIVTAEPVSTPQAQP